MKDWAWADIGHYAFIVLMFVLGLLGEMHVPGIDATVCFATAASALTIKATTPGVKK